MLLGVCESCDVLLSGLLGGLRQVPSRRQQGRVSTCCPLGTGLPPCHGSDLSL